MGNLRALTHIPGKTLERFLSRGIKWPNLGRSDSTYEEGVDLSGK